MTYLHELKAAWVEEAVAKSTKTYRSRYSRRERFIHMITGKEFGIRDDILFSVIRDLPVARRLTEIETSAVARKVERMIECGNFYPKSESEIKTHTVAV